MKDEKKYITPDGYTSDIAVFTIVSENAEAKEQRKKEPPKNILKLLLIKRAKIDAEGKPNIEAGKWALPGGFVDAQRRESALQAAARELKEETGVEDVFLKHFGTYDAWGRDPRGWIISNAHYAIVPEFQLEKRRAADDAAEVELFSLEEIRRLSLAFDHQKVIGDAVSLIEWDMLHSTVARNFLPKEFTLSELQRVLMTVSNHPRITNKSVFFGKAPKLPFLEKVVDENGNLKKTERNSFRPSQLYQFNDTVVSSSIW
ncbi:NUDIX domain-containing protein [Oceanobacillus sp. J11TS1]|uniref:NUDIX domain-containing protein n=1 Tax=Oceanobacillus sp. J11TS1 TaxID=2807191 RepID=UPI001B2DEE82|nr:NUDIX domain-containing protein [Oceanobacillus sp. J11TS1]GIO23509.1 ADP-ribose pyrophosphatase [Oceanobacillus sp. J11TS1]